MKRILITGAFAFAAVGQAFAADLPQPAPPPPRAPAMYVPTMVPVYNWGGIYFGVNAGYGFGKSQWNVTGASTGNFNVSGYTVGPTLGANWQTDALVLGIEGDYDGTGIKGSSGSICTPAACETKNSWLATFRGRVGYAADRVLFYGTAGGAFGNIEANTSTTFQSTSKAGWVAGAGVEAAFADNWSARIEYLFADLENASFTTGAAPTVKFDANLIRFGIDYKFR